MVAGAGTLRRTHRGKAARYPSPKTTEPNSTQVQAEPGAFSRMNPFTVTLAWIWTLALLLAGILALTASSTGGDAEAILLLWAGILLGFGLSALLTWLLANALLWKPQA